MFTLSLQGEECFTLITRFRIAEVRSPRASGGGCGMATKVKLAGHFEAANRQEFDLSVMEREHGSSLETILSGSVCPRPC